MLLNITKLGSEACTEVWRVICGDVSEGMPFWPVKWDSKGHVASGIYDITKLHEACILV